MCTYAFKFYNIEIWNLWVDTILSISVLHRVLDTTRYSTKRGKTIIPSTCKDNGKLNRKTLKSLMTAWNQDIKRLVLQPNLVCLKNKVVVKPGITFEDQSIENKLQCFHVKEYGKVLKIWLSTKVMALSLILEQVVGHFRIDRIAFFFFTLVEQLLRPRGGGGWLVIF